MDQHEIIPPGSTIGILGDGQLGRMTAIAAAKLGYKAAVLGPGGRESPAGQVAYWAESWTAARSTSKQARLEEFCGLVSVVLIEREDVPLHLVRWIEQAGIPVRPSSRVLEIAQDRLLEKQLAAKLDIPIPSFCSVVNGFEVLALASRDGDVVLKTRFGGYDGKGQIRLRPGDSLVSAWHELHGLPCILEEVVDFACEISVIVIRLPWLHGPEMNTITVGPFENEHQDGILRTTRYPLSHPATSGMRKEIIDSACTAAARIARELDLHGILAVEFFVDKDGRVIFNEMAPRPHNSGHLTIECCNTSQFEQYVRAACNLPPGPTQFHARGEMTNIIGDEVKKWPGLLALDDSLHLYGKQESKPGRKMGHVTKRAPL